MPCLILSEGQAARSWPKEPWLEMGTPGDTFAPQKRRLLGVKKYRNVTKSRLLYKNKTSFVTIHMKL